jgi:hypothetical protein
MGRCQPRRAWAIPAVVSVLALVLCSCGATSGVGRPSRSERAEIVAAISRAWSERTREPFRPCCVNGRLGAELARRYPGLAQEHYRPRVVGIRVSKADPDLATAAVAVVNAAGRPTGDDAVFLLEKETERPPSGEPEELWQPGAARTVFPHSCVRSIASAVRELLCPSPWSVLDYSPGALTYAETSVGTVGAHWSEVGLPGSVCGSTAPIHLRWTGRGGDAFVHSTYWPWLPAIAVSASGPYYSGELDEDGFDAYISVDCNTGGGMGPDRLASAVVVFATTRHAQGEARYPLRVVGVITPQQPYETEPASIGHVELVPGKAIVSEYWHGPADSPDFPSGRATTIWTYSQGELISPRTVVDLPPKS